MRKHEINKRKKIKQNRRASAKSQVSKKHKRKYKNKQAHRKWVFNLYAMGLWGLNTRITYPSILLV